MVIIFDNGVSLNTEIDKLCCSLNTTSGYENAKLTNVRVSKANLSDQNARDKDNCKYDTLC